MKLFQEAKLKDPEEKKKFKIHSEDEHINVLSET